MTNVVAFAPNCLSEFLIQEILNTKCGQLRVIWSEWEWPAHNEAAAEWILGNGTLNFSLRDSWHLV
jgi:hypothetical protein